MKIFYAPILFCSFLSACASPETADNGNVEETGCRKSHSCGTTVDAGTTPSPDLATPPAPEPPPPSTPGSFALGNVDPSSGPVGSYLFISGSGFQTGDQVQLTTASSTVTLATVSLTASMIVASCSSVPTGAASVRVARSGATTNSAPFTVTNGKVYFVATTGSDNNAGTLASPWHSIETAAARLQPGDVVYVRAGEYDGEVEIDNSGTAGKPIAVRGYPGESPLLMVPASGTVINASALTIVGSYVTVDRLRISNHTTQAQGATIFKTAHDVTLSNCEISGATNQGLLVSGNNNLIWRNQIHDNGTRVGFNHGVYVEGANNVLRSNVIYNHYMYGIQLYNGYGTGMGGNIVEYNYVFANGQKTAAVEPGRPTAGMIISDGHPNTIVRNNRFCGNANYGVYVDGALSNVTITNNLTCSNGTGGVYLTNPGAGAKVSGNVTQDDGTFALGIISGVTSNANTFWRTDGTQPKLRWNGSDLSFASYKSSSGQDADSKVVNPQIRKVGTAFDAASALSYDFCNTLLPAFCSAAP